MSTVCNFIMDPSHNSNPFGASVSGTNKNIKRFEEIRERNAMVAKL